MKTTDHGLHEKMMEGCEHAVTEMHGASLYDLAAWVAEISDVPVSAAGAITASSMILAWLASRGIMVGDCPPASQDTSGRRFRKQGRRLPSERFDDVRFCERVTCLKPVPSSRRRSGLSAAPKGTPERGARTWGLTFGTTRN